MQIKIDARKRRDDTEYTLCEFQLNINEVGKLLNDGILTIPLRNELDVIVMEYAIRMVKGRADYE